VRIDRASPASPYEQIVEQLRAQIKRGTLVPGTRLPTVRALADQVELVPNTVAKAYRRLEAAGWLETRGRAGTFVAARIPTPPDQAEARLAAAAAAYVARARQLGVRDRDAATAVRRAQRETLRAPDHSPG
jgi:DNA-binding transcriptional regulator YhcF (GntR family)